ncbi:MAG: hypothetical protein JF590_03530 [Gemmatimonadetes bacterium]|nr:hypothetical protein [Gemmatimonadota bacterium]
MRYTLSLSLALAAACAKAPAAPPPAHATASAGIVDSALPRAELLRRFRVDLPAPVSFAKGAPTRDGLGRSVLDALARRDTAQLRAVAVSKGEFGWLYYPTSAQGLPPYDLSPGLYWFMLQERSDRGLRWLLEHPLNAPGRYAGLDCGTRSNVEGANTSWGPCLARWIGPRGDTSSARLFTQVVEREGRWKVLTYSGGQE